MQGTAVIAWSADSFSRFRVFINNMFKESLYSFIYDDN